MSDTTPPNLVSLSLPTTIDVSHGSQPITIVAAATDVGSEIASLQIWLDKPLSYGFGATGAPSGPFPLLLANGSSLDNWDDGQTSTAFNVTAFARAATPSPALWSWTWRAMSTPIPPANSPRWEYR